ncbi:MAG: YgjV family protein [Clostridia bacterium]|nr:YgjV family protein [Clostridia bacterium]
MDAETVLLIANILSLVGNVIATSAAWLKSKRNILLFQSSNHVLEIIAQSMTAAYSGVAQEAVSLIRNISLVFIKSTKKTPKLIISVICLVVGLVAGVLFNIYLSDNVLYGYLPVAGGVAYGVFVILAFVLTLDALDAELLMKIGIIFNAICWSIYGVFIKLYPVMIFNGVAFVLSAVSIVRISIAKRKRRSLPTADSAPSDPPSPPAGE